MIYRSRNLSSQSNLKKSRYKGRNRGLTEYFSQCQSQTICVELRLKYRKLFLKMSACDSWNVEINVLVYENEIFSLLAEFYSAVKKGWQERPFDWIISDFPKAMTVTWSVKNIFMKGWLYLGKTSLGQHICLFSQENLKN